MKPLRLSPRGFTLLEVMISVVLMSFVTAGALAAYIAQLKLTNTQQQTSLATDRARDAIRVISQDVRVGSPGLNALTGGSTSTCYAGTIPFDTGVPAALACLPPIFRSSQPLYYDGAFTGGAPPAAYAPNCGSPTSPGYQLTFGGPAPNIEPTGALGFCPDDLVLLSVDDTNPLFLISNSPPSSINSGLIPSVFAGTNTAAAAPGIQGYGFDDSTIPPGMLLLSGSVGAVLLSLPVAPLGPTPYAAGVGACPTCFVTYTTTFTTSTDLFGSSDNFRPGSIGLPAKLVQYAIRPVNRAGQNLPPFVSADLVRTVVRPMAPPFTPYAFNVVTSQTLVQGVIDMQVEFGLDVQGNGALQYVSSAGLYTPPGPANPAFNSCIGAGGAAFPLYNAVCFPNANNNSLTQLRSVRLNLLVRAGTIDNSKTVTAATASAGISPPFTMRPAVTYAGGGGNLEAVAWGGPPYPTTIDGAEYREISTEIYLRNLGLQSTY